MMADFDLSLINKNKGIFSGGLTPVFNEFRTRTKGFGDTGRYLGDEQINLLSYSPEQIQRMLDDLVKLVSTQTQIGLNEASEDAARRGSSGANLSSQRRGILQQGSETVARGSTNIKMGAEEARINAIRFLLGLGQGQTQFEDQKKMQEDDRLLGLLSGAAGAIPYAGPILKNLFK